MFSSAKFLSPIVTAGLPAPGPLAAAVDVLAGAALELLELDDLLEPHAATTNVEPITPTANRNLPAPPMRLLQVLTAMRCLLVSCLWVSSCSRRRRERRL